MKLNSDFIVELTNIMNKDFEPMKVIIGSSRSLMTKASSLPQEEKEVFIAEIEKVIESITLMIANKEEFNQKVASAFSEEE